MISSLDILRLVVDFGLVVLIWLVQLVIYPSFHYYPSDRLLKWHQLYTARVTYVVMPLMLGQLILILLQLWQQVDWYSLISFGILTGLWGSTFLYFIPLHGQIDSGNSEQQTLQDLVKHNWGRTLGWSLLLGLSVLNVFVNIDV